MPIEVLRWGNVRGERNLYYIMSRRPDLRRINTNMRLRRGNRQARPDVVFFTGEWFYNQRGRRYIGTACDYLQQQCVGRTGRQCKGFDLALNKSRDGELREVLRPIEGNIVLDSSCKSCVQNQSERKVHEHVTAIKDENYDSVRQTLAQARTLARCGSQGLLIRDRATFGIP